MCWNTSCISFKLSIATLQQSKHQSSTTKIILFVLESSVINFTPRKYPHTQTITEFGMLHNYKQEDFRGCLYGTFLHCFQSKQYATLQSTTATLSFLKSTSTPFQMLSNLSKSHWFYILFTLKKRGPRRWLSG